MSKSKKNQNQTETVNEEVVNTEEVVDTTEQLIEGEPVSAETNPEGEKIEATEGDAVGEKVEVTAPADITETEVTETPVVEPSVTETSTEPTVENTEGTETSTEPVVENNEGAEKADESGKDEKPAQVSTLSAKTSSSDRYGDDIDDGDKDDETSDTPVVTPSTPTITESEEIVDRALMNKELNTPYNVKFTYSEASKRFAINRKMTLLAMYDLFVKNRNAFVGLKSQDDFNHISEFMNKYSVLYNYKEIPKAGKRQFLDKLRSATDYVLLGR